MLYYFSYDYAFLVALRAARNFLLQANSNGKDNDHSTLHWPLKPLLLKLNATTPQWHGRIDGQRVGIIGQSLGAMTVLGAAGASFDPAQPDESPECNFCGLAPPAGNRPWRSLIHRYLRSEPARLERREFAGAFDTANLFNLEIRFR